VEESAFGGSMQAVGHFCIVVFDKNLASFALNVVSHLIYFMNTFYKFCIFNAIYKDNAAINCVAV
jgi:hypothetical protein